MIKQLISPVGIFFIIIFLSYIPSILRRFSIVPFKRVGGHLGGQSAGRFLRVIIIFSLYFASTPIVANIIVDTIYRDLSAVDIGEIKKYDSIVVLGGSTRFDNYNNRSQLGSDGDRLLFAKQLFLAGKVKRYILSGGLAEMSEDSLSEAERDARILSSMGIDQELIYLESMSGNTIENADNIVSNFPHLNKQIAGLITSAVHMRRAHWLFCQRGLNLDKIPASIPLMRKPENTISWFIPTVGNLVLADKYLKERVAMAYYQFHDNSQSTVC